MEQMTVSVDRLVIDEANVRRKIAQDSIESMKASIIAHGVIQPLAVRPPVESDADLGGQLYRVTGGGRRMRALQELLSEGKIGSDYAVPIIVRDFDDNAARSISLAENIIRTDMDPLDEFRAFKELVANGYTIEDVAAHFGQSNRFVRQRLALANVHPKILEVYERDAISLAAVMAYASNPDQEAQIRFFEEGPNWQIGEPRQIRYALNQNSIRATSKLAEFVGEDAYDKAGGGFNEDLFEDSVYWTDPDLARTLANAKIEKMKEELAGEGWSFVTTLAELGVQSWDLRKQQPEGQEISEDDAARMTEIADKWEGYDDDIPEELYVEYEKEMEEYEQLEKSGLIFTPEQKETLGVVIDTERYTVIYGVHDPKAKPGKPGDGSDSAAAGEDEKPKKDPLALTTPLKEQIGDAATAALAEAITADPQRALAFLAAQLELRVANVPQGFGVPCRVDITRIDYGAMGGSKNQRSFINAFRAYDKMKPKEFTEAFAGLIAQTVDLSEKWFKKEYTADDKVEVVRRECINAFAADATKHIDYEAWFTKCTKPMIEEAWAELKGNPPSLALPAKKADMAAMVAVEAQKRGWLPKELRGKGYKLKAE